MSMSSLAEATGQSRTVGSEHDRHAIRLVPLARDGPPLPRPSRAYLGLGAKICGRPAIGRAFKTIDLLTLRDLRRLPALVRAHFRIA